jgi:hypothetical protein
MIRKTVLALILALVAAPCSAATCFWVGGTGTLNGSNTTSWASGSGGSGGTCAAVGGIPLNAADQMQFDGSSGGGTVTVATDISIVAITSNAFTGTIDWTVNNNNMTLSSSFTSNGTGTRTLKFGSGTLTLTGLGGGTPWNVNATNMTFNAGTSTIVLQSTTATQRTFTGAALTYHNVTFDTNTTGGSIVIQGSNTFNGTLTLKGKDSIFPTSGTTQTITNLAVSGTSSNPVLLQPTLSNSIATLSVSGTVTATWASVFGITCTGAASWAFSNSLDSGQNTGCNVTPPIASGSAAGIIGGWLFDNDNVPAFLNRAA